MEQLEAQKASDRCLAVLYWAEWHAPCSVLRDQMAEMAKVFPLVKFAWANADTAAELVDKLDVQQVPTLALFHPHKAAPETIENPSPESLSEIVEHQQEFYAKWFEEERKKAYREIEDLVTQQPQFFMFIKGTPEQPKCKFTRKLLELFAPHGYRYKSFDILKDERIRQWLKFYSSWPTFPQVFLAGKFVGGVDIVSELVEAGEFDAMVPQPAKRLAPADEFKELLAQHKVLAILEGSADSQSTPASQKLAGLLKACSVTYTALDVLHRSDLLKALLGSQLPSVPCLFVEGQLLGDLARVEALAQAG